jgi:transposase InsO family protein
MRYPASEKLEIIRLVEQSHLPARQTLDQLGIARRTFYRWYDRFLEGGPEALEDKPSAPSRVWNRIGQDIQDQIVGMALEQTELSPRELAVRFTDEKRYFVSEATVYRLLKAHDLITSPAYVVIKAADAFHTKTTRVNEMWQTDFTYFKIIGWGWMYLSTVLDDYSRYIIAWKLCANMRAQDVTDTLDLALAASGCDSARAPQAAPAQRQWSQLYRRGTGPVYQGPRHEPCARRPNAPQTQGKIERWHQTLKNRILLENYFLPGDLERQIEAFIEHYNHQRYHESLKNVTPADAYFGRAPAIIKQREIIKRQTIEHRRLLHRKLAA